MFGHAWERLHHSREKEEKKNDTQRRGEEFENVQECAQQSECSTESEQFENVQEPKCRAERRAEQRGKLSVLACIRVSISECTCV
jgi:hypothetical protein